MRPLISLLFLIICHPVFCQSTGKPESTNNVIPSSVQQLKIVSTKHWQQLMADPSNANTWLDYYKWIENNKELKISDKQQQLSQTVQLSKQYIAASWQFSLMNFIQSGKRNRSFLDAAIDQSDNKAMVYPYAIQFAIISKNKTLLKEYAAAFNQLAPLSPALTEYHYNALISAANNAAIYAKGLTDLAPMAVLQQVYGIRKDVSLNYYEGKITDSVNSYLCLSSGKDIIQNFPSADYTGLLVKVSGNESPENLQQLSTKFRLTELKKLQSLDESEKAIYKNYLPFFILLYRSYKMNNDTAAATWKQLAQKVGNLTGSSESVNKILSE